MSDRLQGMLEQLAKRLEETNARMESIGNGNGNGSVVNGGGGNGNGHSGAQAAAGNGTATATTRLEAMIAQLARRLDETNQRIETMTKRIDEGQSASLSPFPGLNLVNGAKVKSFHAYEGLTRKVHAFSDTLMLTEHHMAKGSVFPRHSHPHEQLAYLISGHIRICCGDYTFEAHGGDSFVVAGGIEHQVWAIEESIALDIFTPVREDYLEFKS